MSAGCKAFRSMMRLLHVAATKKICGENSIVSTQNAIELRIHQWCMRLAIVIVRVVRIEISCA
jgi:hypothetical protein